MSRRQFIKASALAGGGLLLACHLPFGGRDAAAAGGGLFAPNAFLRIGPDESVTVIVNKSEMGQGVYTSLPMLVAEELCCDWKRVAFQASPVAPEYNHSQFGPIMVTGGSTSVRSEWDRLSLAGAAAREMLVTAAAQQWKVDPSACRAENGVVHGPRRQAAQLRQAGGPGGQAAGAQGPETEVRCKKAARQAASSPGQPGQDQRHGCIRHRCPGPGYADRRDRPFAGLRRPGSRASMPQRPRLSPECTRGRSDQGGVAVVADGFWPALKGREMLEIAWDEGTGAQVSTSAMREEYARLAATPGMMAHKSGDAPAVLAKAAERFEVEYEVPYLAHAPMEPLNCFVDLKSDSCLIRTGSQFQTMDRNAAAAVAGLKPEQVTLETTFLGGGFGRRACTGSDYVVEAVQVAKAVKQPVLVIRTREDDMRAGYYRPMWFDKVTACLDGRGLPLAWHHRIVGQSIIAGTSFELS